MYVNREMVWGLALAEQCAMCVQHAVKSKLDATKLDFTRMYACVRTNDSHVYTVRATYESLKQKNIQTSCMCRWQLNEQHSAK